MYFCLGFALAILAVSALYVKFPKITVQSLKKIAGWVGITEKTIN